MTKVNAASAVPAAKAHSPRVTFPLMRAFPSPAPVARNPRRARGGSAVSLRSRTRTRRYRPRFVAPATPLSLIAGWLCLAAAGSVQRPEGAGPKTRTGCAECLGPAARRVHTPGMSCPDLPGCPGRPAGSLGPKVLPGPAAMRPDPSLVRVDVKAGNFPACAGWRGSAGPSLGSFVPGRFLRPWVACQGQGKGGAA